jgi:1-aminocyclopropane-1-carboxylate deaminase
VSIHDFERYPLTFGPSPIHRLDRLSRFLAGAQVWAKRDDCNSGLAFGGNKIRKLEYIVPDVLAQGADTLVSIGGLQSNHTRQVAAVAAKLGLRCHLVQEDWVHWDDPGNSRVGNILLSRIMGADVRLHPAGFDIGMRPSWEEAIREVEKTGGKPYGIPAGASEHPLGGLGFVNWAYEVAMQEKELGVFFDTIIVCTVTGSTHAGMVAGFAALQETGGGRPRRVLGIDASATLDRTRDQVARIAHHTAALIGVDRELHADEITVLEGWAGDRYGIPVESTIQAIRMAARIEGMIVDPVYEGKSMAGLIDLVVSHEVERGSTVLYAHLGGQPALNAYSGIFGSGDR